MKSWFFFGTGMVLGVTLGALGAAYFLFDDEISKKSLGTGAPVAASHGPAQGVKKADKADLAALSPAEVAAGDVKPVAATAEAVDLDSLPEADHDSVISTVKREEAGPPSAQPQ
jgi:hypothetical protein